MLARCAAVGARRVVGRERTLAQCATFSTKAEAGAQFTVRNPQYEADIRAAFQQQGLMGHLGASIVQVEPGLVTLEVRGAHSPAAFHTPHPLQSATPCIGPPCTLHPLPAHPTRLQLPPTSPSNTATSTPAHPLRWGTRQAALQP